MKTGLRIRVLEGQTLDGGTEYEFPASPRQPNELIVIGRDPDHCQIVFTDELRHRGLGNEHLAFRRSLARYQLDLNTQNPVLVDGRKAFEEKELRGTHVIRLGDAVELEVTVVDDRSATIGDRDHEQPHEITLGNRRLLSVLAAGVAMLAVGGWWLGSQQSQLEETTAQVAKQFAEAAVPAAALDQAARSVYLIVTKSDAGGEDAIGTGWSAPGGVIVTNAHIAEEIPASPDTVRWFVRSAAPPYREHVVRAHRSHPGFQAFQAFIGAIKPVQEEISRYAGVGRGLACDVAVLEVDDPSALAPPLPIPSRDELATLAAGDPIAIAGFPTEGLAATPVLMAAPVPVRHRGFLVRVTDFFMRQREDGMNQFIQHGLPVTGGSSGSPIIDSRGRVIAVHNGGNTLGSTDAGRIISQVVSFSQRADLVLDLLEHQEAERLADYRSMWADSLGDFQQESDVRLADHFRETAAVIGRSEARPKVLQELPGQALAVGAGEDLGRAVPVDLELPAGVFTLRVAATTPASTADLDIAVLDRHGNAVEQDETLSLIGLVRIINMDPQTLRLVGWVQNAAEPLPYACTVFDWQCDAERYVFDDLARSLSSQLETREQPRFDTRTNPVPLARSTGSAGRCGIETRIPQPGIYAAIGRVSASLPVAMTLVGGGRSLDANTAPASATGDGRRSQSPIVVFQVDEADSTVRFECESATLEESGDAPQMMIRVFGWPGHEFP